jgi:hypothetical protein
MKIENDPSLKFVSKLLTDLADDDTSALITLADGSTVELTKEAKIEIGADYIAHDVDTKIKGPLPIVRIVIPFTAIQRVDLVI